MILKATTTMNLILLAELHLDLEVIEDDDDKVEDESDVEETVLK